MSAVGVVIIIMLVACFQAKWHAACSCLIDALVGSNNTFVYRTSITTGNR